MERKKISEIKTLIGRLVVVGGLVLVGVLVYRWWFSNSKGDDFVIDDTPLHVEEIRKIIELNTIRFHDEVVVDSVEYYRNAGERLNGNYEKLYDPDQIQHAVRYSNVKRRLTLIVKGELLYGFDLKRKEFSVTPKDGKLVVRVPNPELLSINLTPENTEVFVENGEWRDYERQMIQRKARNKMIASGERLQLEEKAKKPLEKLLGQLIRSDMPIVVEYY
jgi:hypothetical protein